MFNFVAVIICGAFVANQIVRVTLWGVNFAVLDAVILGVSLIWIGRERKELRKIFWNDSIGRAWLYFVLAALFSLTVNIAFLNVSSFLVAGLYLFRWGMYGCIFFIVRYLSREQKAKIPQYLILCGSIIVFLGYLQYFFYSNLRNVFYLGWDEHMYRLFSVFLDPNFAGAFFVLFIIFLSAHLIRSPQIANLRDHRFQKIILLLTIVALLLTFSRSGLIMFLVSLFVLFIFENRRKFIVLLLLGMGVFVLTISQFFYLENINLFRTASSHERIISAQHALNIIRQQPLFGVGFNAYKYAQVRMNYRTEFPQILSHADAGTDASLLFLIATTGIVGTGFYGYFWYQLLRNLWVNRGGKWSVNTTIAFVSVLGIFINSFFINSLFYPSIMLWLWVVLGLNDYK